jgi:type VII secretion protein EccB
VASKKDLIEAQSFSRRRLLTAFTSGAVGTGELEPAKPLRAVAAGLALTALVVIGGVFYGLISPGLPSGWDNNRLVIAKDTGARYVSANGTLYPVVNTASARLLVPSTQFALVTTTSARIASIPVGPSVGIVGAPDRLPTANGLVDTGWTSCLTEDGTPDVRISTATGAKATAGAVVATTDAGVFVVAGTRRYQVDPNHVDSVLRALGLGDTEQRRVDDRWLNLFEPGTELTPLVVQDAGKPLAGSTLAIGQAVHVAGSPATERYVVQSDGALAALSPLAYQLYLLGTGALSGPAADVSAATIEPMHNATAPAGAKDWPLSTPTSLADDATACALSTSTDGRPGSTLALSAATTPATGVQVDAGGGALVRAGGPGEQSAGTIYLVDATGTAFPVAPDAETLARLGYTATNVGRVTTGWIALLPVGPKLSTTAAGESVLATSGQTSTP